MRAPNIVIIFETKTWTTKYKREYNIAMKKHGQEIWMMESVTLHNVHISQISQIAGETLVELEAISWQQQEITEFGFCQT